MATILPTGVNRIRAGNWDEKYGTAHSNRTRFIGTFPTPTATPQAAPAPTDPYAWADQYGTEEGYYAANKAAVAGGGKPLPNPLEGQAPIQHPSGGLGSVINPWNRTGAPITAEQFGQLQGRMSMYVRPSLAAQGKQFSENYIGGQAGGTGNTPIPMRQLILGNTQAPDDVILKNPGSIAPDVYADYKRTSNEIRKDFVGFMSRNTGFLTLNELLDFGDDLANRYSNHSGFIRNMLQTQIRGNQQLGIELQNLRTTGNIFGVGNAAFRAAVPEGQQEQFIAALRSATSKDGFIFPELAKMLGLNPTKNELGAAYTVTTAAGENVPVTPEIIGKIAQQKFGIGATQAAQPVQTEGPGTGIIRGAGGEVISSLNSDRAINAQRSVGIGTITNAKGETIARIQGFGDVDNTKATQYITRLRAAGDPASMQLAAQLENAFGMTKGKPATTPPAAKAATPTQAKESNFIRENAQGDTKVWNPKLEKWQTITSQETKQDIETALIYIKNLSPGMMLYNFIEALGAGAGKGAANIEARIREQIAKANKAWENQ